MEDLLQSQIQGSCRLALPNGLKELMSDISREVLRAQPQNLLQFITDYLSSLLTSRENLYIAAQVCNAVCACDCRPELEEELRLSLDESFVTDVADFIEKHIGKCEVTKENLLMKLISKTSIEERHLPAVLAAVRNTFLRHQRNHTQIYEDAQAYKVNHETENASIKTNSKTPSSSESIVSSLELIETHVVSSNLKSIETLEKTKVTFGSIDRGKKSDLDIYSADQPKIDAVHQAFPPGTKLSSTSAGSSSLLSLPKYRPYSAHDFDTLEDTPEKERSNFDYTRESLPDDEEISTSQMTKENERKHTSVLFELPGKEVSDEESESMEDDDSIEDNMLLEPTSAVKEIDKDMNVLDDVVEENIRNTDVDVLELDEDLVEEVIMVEKSLSEHLVPIDQGHLVPTAKIDVFESNDGEDIEEAGGVVENNVNEDFIDKVEEKILVDAEEDSIDDIPEKTDGYFQF